MEAGRMGSRFTRHTCHARHAHTNFFFFRISNQTSFTPHTHTLQIQDAQANIAQLEVQRARLQSEVKAVEAELDRILESQKGAQRTYAGIKQREVGVLGCVGLVRVRGWGEGVP